jgi:hypothetical protein
MKRRLNGPSSLFIIDTKFLEIEAEIKCLLFLQDRFYGDWVIGS